MGDPKHGAPPTLSQGEERTVNCMTNKIQEFWSKKQRELRVTKNKDQPGVEAERAGTGRRATEGTTRVREQTLEHTMAAMDKNIKTIHDRKENRHMEQRGEWDINNGRLK